MTTLTSTFKFKVARVGEPFEGNVEGNGFWIPFDTTMWSTTFDIRIHILKPHFL